MNPVEIIVIINKKTASLKRSFLNSYLISKNMLYLE